MLRQHRYGITLDSPVPKGRAISSAIPWRGDWQTECTLVYRGRK
jgi:hypothetical protein